MGCLDAANQRAWPCLVGRILCVLDVAGGGPFSSVWHIKPEKASPRPGAFTREREVLLYKERERKKGLVWPHDVMGTVPKGALGFNLELCFSQFSKKAAAATYRGGGRGMYKSFTTQS